MSENVKICHVQLLPLLTGVQNVTISELVGLDSHIYEKHLVCNGIGPLTNKCKKLGIEYHICKNLKRDISVWKDLLSLFWLFLFFRKHKFDIVHTHSSKTGVLGRIAAKLAGVPMVVHTVHGFGFPSASSRLQRSIFILLERIGSRCSDKIITLHDIDMKICLDLLHCTSTQLEIIPNGVDTEIYYPIDRLERNCLRTCKNLPNDKLIIGMVGRLWKQKNPQVLLNSALEILSIRNDVCFVFVGDGELRDQLESQVPVSFVENILFLGWRDDTCELLKCFDIFILPSLWEGMPLAIIEALASGLPCVVSDIPGNNHLVEDGVNGYVFPLSNPEVLTHCINKVLDDKELSQNMSKSARQVVEIKYSIDNRIRTIETLYVDFRGVS